MLGAVRIFPRVHTRAIRKRHAPLSSLFLEVMSALEACRLHVGARFFMRWEPKDEDAPLQCVVVYRVEMFADLNPRRLLVHVMRKNINSDGSAGVNLTIHQRDAKRAPTITFTETGELVSWAMPPQELEGGKSHALSISRPMNAHDVRSSSEDSNFNTDYLRPIRTLSYKVYDVLSEFPAVSGRDIESFGSMIHKDLRACTSCTLQEWESLVWYVSTVLRINVRHQPEFVAENVPRYDEDDMTIHFLTLRNLLLVFRHLTVQHVRSIVVKEKTRRKRLRATGNDAFSTRGTELVQVIGDCVSRDRVFAFTVGSVFQPGIEVDADFRYPVLFRSCEHWNNRDRMFEDELSLLWKTPQEIQSIWDDSPNTSTSAGNEKRPRERSRIKESFLGFKWVKDAEKGPVRSLFHSFDARNIQGNLHFCVPSIVFVGSLYAPHVLRLCSEERGLFNHR